MMYSQWLLTLLLLFSAFRVFQLSSKVEPERTFVYLIFRESYLFELRDQILSQGWYDLSAIRLHRPVQKAPGSLENRFSLVRSLVLR